MSEPIRALVADDHSIIRVGVTELLKVILPDLLVTEVGDGAEALQQCLSENWDLIFLDIRLPTVNGLEILQQAKPQRPELRFIMLSMHYGPEYVLHSLKLGASAYLAKEMAAEELAMCVQDVLDGKTYVSQSIVEHLGGKLHFE